MRAVHSPSTFRVNYWHFAGWWCLPRALSLSPGRAGTSADTDVLEHPPCEREGFQAKATAGPEGDAACLSPGLGRSRCGPSGREGKAERPGATGAKGAGSEHV